MWVVRVCLIAIASVIAGPFAHADIPALCATVAANSANPMVTDVDRWLTRFRGFYTMCLSQHEAADGASVPAKGLKETIAVKPVNDKTAAKPAVKTVSKQKFKTTNQVIAKATKKIQVLPARTPVNLPLPGGRLIRAPKTKLPDAGAESWRVNCSERFGGFNKNSQTYLSNAGKRVSCVVRPKSARG